MTTAHIGDLRTTLRLNDHAIESRQPIGHKIVEVAGAEEVSISPATTKLAGAQTSTGLAANAKLATVGQIGDQTGDSFTYTLGGTGASAFGLTSANNVGTLSAGAWRSGAPPLAR